METTELPASARIARKALKLVALPLIVLAVVVRFTIPPSTWWIDGVFIALCLVAVVLAAVGRVPARKDKSGDSQDSPAG